MQKKSESKKVKQVVEGQSQQENERYYCTNSNLLREMFKWKNSTKKGIPVMKLKKDKNGKIKLENTQVYEDTIEKHEKFKTGIKYVIRYPKTHERYQYVSKLLEEQKEMDKKSNSQNLSPRKQMIKILKETQKYILEDVTKKVERMGYAFDIDDNEMNRTISEEFGVMMMNISNKISNRSEFRNYDEGTKQECKSYAIEKIIKGLPNYNFKYDNVFAYISQACFNSFKSILSKYYKYVNLKRDITKRASMEYSRLNSNSSVSRCLNNQFKGNDFDDFSEY